jgi:hypothetical protein
MIFIFGFARSGSTWLGKIFDSHPDLLYLHEPDISDRGIENFPHWFTTTPTSKEIAGAALYLRRLLDIRDARTIGIRPFFRKSYRGTAAEAAHLSLIYAAKLLERIEPVRVANAIHIPDLAFGHRPLRTVIKSVSALGRAEALLAADSSLIPLHLIRHPCGFIASMLRGAKRNLIDWPRQLGRLAATRSAERLGLDRDNLNENDDVAILAWSWLLSNAEAHSAIRKANGLVLNYDTLASDPLAHVCSLFNQLQLGWPVQTQNFLQLSQSSEGGYFSVFRNSREAAERWRTELDKATVARIRSIVCRDPVGAQFFDV